MSLLAGKLGLFVRRKSPHELVTATEVRCAEGQEAPAYALSRRARRLSELAPHEREMVPYFLGAVAHSDRIGRLEQQAASYRSVAFGLLAGCLVLGGGLVWMAARYAETRVVPYLVHVDQHGIAVAQGPLERAGEADPVNVMAALSRWVIGLRTVTGQPVLQKDFVARAHSFVAKNTVASQKVREWFASHPPVDGTGRRVRIEIQRIAPVADAASPAAVEAAREVVPVVSPRGGQEYRVEWTEEASDFRGEHVERTQWTALLTVAFSPLQDLRALIDNPVGVFVTDFNISRVQ
jgi:type IV secretion system protein TrbF